MKNPNNALREAAFRAANDAMTAAAEVYIAAWEGRPTDEAAANARRAAENAAFAIDPEFAAEDAESWEAHRSALTAAEIARKAADHRKEEHQ